MRRPLGNTVRKLPHLEPVATLRRSLQEFIATDVYVYEEGADWVRKELAGMIDWQLADRHKSLPGIKGHQLLFISLHPYAIDYWRQAPVLARNLISERELRQYAQFRHALHRIKGLKLRQVMADMSIPYAFRKLKVILSSRHICDWLCDLDQNQLQQLIPDGLLLQRRWLESIDAWYMRATRQRACALPPSFPSPLWIAQNALELYDYPASELSDYLMRGDAPLFNPGWSARRVIEESLRWHEEYVHATTAAAFFKQYGFDWNHIIPIDPFPLKWEKDGLEFRALRTGKELNDEGEAMHHCVGSYFDRVVEGNCLIYSVWKDDRHRATMEVGITKYHVSLSQLKARRNHLPNFAAKEYDTIKEFVRELQKRHTTSVTRILLSEPWKG